jgi:hypothetical protein
VIPQYNDTDTLRIKQQGEYRLSDINNSGESIKNRNYLLEFEAWEESICEKIRGKKSCLTVPVSNYFLHNSGKRKFDKCTLRRGRGWGQKCKKSDRNGKKVKPKGNNGKKNYKTGK